MLCMVPPGLNGCYIILSTALAAVVGRRLPKYPIFCILHLFLINLSAIVPSY